MHRTLCHAALCTLAAALHVLAPSPVAAQGYPAKPIKLVVPFPAGGVNDFVARLAAQKLSDGVRQPVVVESKPGAGATIGADSVAKSPPDGYTLLFGGQTPLVTSPSIFPKVPYDPVRDFAPISTVTRFHLVLTAHPSVPANTLEEFIALAKGVPGKINFGSAPTGTSPHLAAVLLKQATATEFTVVPYKSGAHVLAAVLAGEVSAIFEVPFLVGPQIRSGKLKGLVVTRATRYPDLPNVPTAAEAGLPGFDVGGWFALVAPRGTPPEIITLLNAEFRRMWNTPEVREALEARGFEQISSSPEELAAQIRAEIPRWSSIIKAGAVKVD
jgi:tripartite-type tricarboxylate transporter receptor subunit TctC